MNTATNHTETSLNELTLTTITGINNYFANLIAVKPTKRFGTKPAAVKKCLLNQAEFNKQFPPKKESPEKVENTSAKKAPKSKITGKLIVLVKCSKGGTMESLINCAIGADSDIDAVVKFVIYHRERPSSLEPVTRTIVIRNIGRLVKKGRLVVKA